jgi:hypothetical protein
MNYREQWSQYDFGRMTQDEVRSMAKDIAGDLKRGYGGLILWEPWKDGEGLTLLIGRDPDDVSKVYVGVVGSGCNLVPMAMPLAPEYLRSNWWVTPRMSGVLGELFTYLAEELK